MTVILEYVVTAISGIFVLIIIPTMFGLMVYGTYWAHQRHVNMLKVFDAFKEMGTCGCVPAEIVIRCAREISELTSSEKNKLVATRAKSTLLYIEDQTKYYKAKKAAEREN